jgi:hypothetical protein
MTKITVLTSFVLAVATLLMVGSVLPPGSVQGSAPLPTQIPQADPNPCIVTEQGGDIDVATDIDTDIGSDIDADINCDFTGQGDIEGGGSQGPP